MQKQKANNLWKNDYSYLWLELYSVSIPLAKRATFCEHTIGEKVIYFWDPTKGIQSVF